MQIAPLPVNEASRLARLHGLDLLDTPDEERFDRIARLARRIFDVPIALVSLIDANRQWFKSCFGLEARETSRDVSFCAHAILSDDTLVIPDATLDPRFAGNPLVTGAPGIRFYAGHPLALPDGTNLGTLCLIDTRPREIDATDLSHLRDLANLAEREVAAVQLATLDSLTALSNRRGFEMLSQQALNACRRRGLPASLLFFDLDGFKQINDRFGHAEGDRALVLFARSLTTVLREMDVIGRLGGDEFVALVMSEQLDVQALVERLRKDLGARGRQAGLEYEIRFSVGHVDYDPRDEPSVARLLAESDLRMYADKSRMKSRAAPH
ncbi:GGDEF domain-containing protein [Burkholderia glumae]|uniref:Sensor domain-containing diguanylate cyclase n=1 Tax=Burkholderia glumae TaxID=337 RepID=A0AAP9Y2N4_BURGL|nr:sensor domain-containing diguanylate cyclase [Burkholderia glumae]ACR28956.1 Diguanylate cyclase [Burkholderia glumae BGR1]AJY65924.1 diguanylate cyclase domain protein [Burkholderia glumae LMG 2196 = ATCC 33617]KHJ62534.1 diguanylate cyclase [Burkholderia glumae]MCM2483203.1 sensor domain-containing diguanylate cyclase [Burkholderia glumae]MCM2493342.1 sensor domain-containing diguanylate cyclase [Burkholderia glumae]